jgi:hypothetical protein
LKANAVHLYCSVEPSKLGWLGWLGEKVAIAFGFARKLRRIGSQNPDKQSFWTSHQFFFLLDFLKAAHFYN